MLSQQQIDTVKATIPVLQQHGGSVTCRFYRNILSENPSLNELFNQGNQITGHQAQALAGSVLAYAQNIDNLAALGPAVQHICQKHVSLHVKPELYSAVGKYLLEAFGQILGDAFTPTIRDAWAAAYGQLANIMIETEQKLEAEGKDWPEWRDFIVKEKNPESDVITSFVLVPADKKPLPLHLPGQYISIKVPVPRLGYGQIRQYSLSDKPSSKQYRISVRREAGHTINGDKMPRNAGLVSNVLHKDISVGDIVQLTRPMGDFVLAADQNETDPIVLLSAGVGLTPLMSMLNTLLEAHPRKPVAWISGARNTKEQAFANHVRSQADAHENLRAVVFLANTDETDQPDVHFHHGGRMDLGKCDKKLDLFLDNPKTQYYMCGPVSFMSATQKKLEDYGVATERIKSERFGPGPSV